MSAKGSNREIRKEQKRIGQQKAREEERIAKLKTKKEERESPKKHRVVARRKIKVEKDPEPVQDKRQNGILFPLWKIAKEPSTRTSVNKDPHYTVITRHLFNFNGTKEFKTMFFIPEGAEIVLVPENSDTPAHYRVQMGDAFVYISTEFGEVKPGMSIEGWAELKVKVAKRPNIGPRRLFYPYTNFWKPLEEDQLPEFILELNSKKWFVANGNFAFTPASGKDKTILHMSKINNATKITKK